MSQTFGSGLTSITGSVTVSINGSVPAYGTNQTPVQITGQNVDSSGATLYTVTAGKTFYLCGFYNTGGSTAGEIRDNATLKLFYPAVAGTIASCNISAPVAFTHSVRLGGGTGTIYISMWGYEVTTP